MSREVRWEVSVTGLAAAALLAAGCSGGEENAPQASPSDGPRSIFQTDNEPAGVSDVAPETLRPLETTISFADGTTDLTEAARAELATIVDSPQMDAGGRIVLRGHTDSSGSDEGNLEASRLKAEAIRDFLVENDIDEERIEIIAFGEQNPIAPNALPDGSPNEEGRATNRRVEITIETGREAGREQTLIETLSEPGESPTPKPTASASASPAQ